MKKLTWGYIRYLILWVVATTALLWSLTVAPALADTGSVFSMPFLVASHWTSASDTTPGISWQTGDSETRFAISNGKFVSTSPDDTWFIYGWFGPLSAILQPYNIKYPEWGNRHNGIDFAGREGIEIVSSSSGQVIFAGKKIGNTVIVKTPEGYQITYGHLQDIAVRKGTKVKTGDLIGHLGKTGTTNPHLHFQVDLIKKGMRKAVNPVSLLDIDWDNVVIPDAEANSFYIDNQNPFTQLSFNW